jgi:osmotically-inducible protein OsmY
VRSYYLKQIAQTIVMGLEGVDEIHNRLEVTTPPGRR